MCGIRCLIWSEPSSTRVPGKHGGNHEEGASAAVFFKERVFLIPQWLRRRGPDEQQSIAIPIPFDNSTTKTNITTNTNNHPDRSLYCILQASVLCLRPLFISQPVELVMDATSCSAQRSLLVHDETINIGKSCSGDSLSPSSSSCCHQRAHFCWNGEIYQVLNETDHHNNKPFPWEQQQKASTLDSNPQDDVTTKNMPSDTQWMAQQIQQILWKEPNAFDSSFRDEEDLDKEELIVQERLEALGNLLSRLNAEFAFCLVVSSSSSSSSSSSLGNGIYFGRDALGRRSLVAQTPPRSNTATTTTTKTNSTEQEQQKQQQSGMVQQDEEDEFSSSTMSKNDNVAAKNGTIYNNGGRVLFELSSVATSLPGTIGEEEKGEDAFDCLTGPVGIWKEVPPSVIGYYNWNTQQTRYHSWTMFEPPHAVVPQSTEASSHCSIDQEANEESRKDLHASSLPGLLSPVLRNEYCHTLYCLLRQAVERRLQVNATTVHSKCAVLFSGGLDSTILAYLALKFMGPSAVQLVNVSFVDDDDDDNQNQNNLKLQMTSYATSTKTKTKKMKPTAADTKAAQESLHDLQQIFQDSTFALTHRTVTWSEVQALQRSRIPQLLYPKQQDQDEFDSSKDVEKASTSATPSAMDMNVATALWFAADTAVTAETENRILMTGLGADEYMGGYTRHRRAFQQGGPEQLRRELELDQSRLWYRNCGRDDRILADTGQEVRYPFLDVHVTHFLSRSCPLEVVCDLTLPPGQGDKRLLRMLAQDLGLTSASQAVKRAIQFGSRISHVVDKQRFGSRRKANQQQKSHVRHHHLNPKNKVSD
ncbi:hypothetical protein ACA910_004266 [Epithemia clementina (nom. ined.)]